MFALGLHFRRENEKRAAQAAAAAAKNRNSISSASTRVSNQQHQRMPHRAGSTPMLKAHPSSTGQQQQNHQPVANRSSKSSVSSTPASASTAETNLPSRSVSVPGGEVVVPVQLQMAKKRAASTSRRVPNNNTDRDRIIFSDIGGSKTKDECTLRNSFSGSMQPVLVDGCMKK